MLQGAALSPVNEIYFYQTNRVNQPGQDPNKKKKVLVYYIGGITYAEIAAIRFLNRLFKDKQFVIATT